MARYDLPDASSSAALRRHGVSRLDGLRVAIIGPLAPPAGGMAGQTRQLAELLGSSGSTVCVVQTNRPYRPAWVDHLRGFRALFRLLPFLMEVWRAAGRVQVFHIMANSGWAWHLFAAPVIWIAWARRTSVVVNYRGGEAASFLERRAGLVRASMRRVPVLAVPSGFLHEIFARHGMTADVLPNVVDLSLFHPAEHQRVRGAHLVVTRNLEPLYDNATALHAFARVCQRHPEARLTIAGTGPQEGVLRQLAETLGVADRVTFAGQLARSEVASLLRNADVCLNPSLVDNMPNSILEAMASGVPVVSTAVGGVPYIAEHERTALLVPPGQPEFMAEAVMRLLDEASLWQRLAANARIEIQRYTWERVAPVLAGLYAKALATA